MRWKVLGALLLAVTLVSDRQLTNRLKDLTIFAQ